MIRSHDHDEDDACTRVPVSPKAKMAARKFQLCKFIFHKYSQMLLEYDASVRPRVF